MARKTPVCPDPTPAALKALDRWCCYREDKSPLDAKSSDPSTCTSFDAAWERFKTDDRTAGLNFLPGGDDDLVIAGFDFDAVVDEDGVVDPRVESIVEELQTYAEFSPSGTGVRLWCYVPSGTRNISKPTEGFEFYAGNHFLSVTGNANLGAPRTLATLDAETPKRLCREFVAATVDSESEKPRQRETKQRDESHELVKTAERCIDQLADTRAEDYAEWIQVLAALRWVERESGQDMTTTWHTFSERSAKYDRDQCQDKWDSFEHRENGDDRLTVGSLVHWASEDSGIDKGELTGRSAARLDFVLASDVEPVPVRWLWKGRIPQGKTTLLSGDPGDGKSFVCIDLAARISKGTQWPDGQRCPQGDVLVLNTEDDMRDTLVPRLITAGADLDRVEIFDGVKLKGRRTMLDLGKHADLLESALQARPNLQLVVIDPLGRFSGGADNNSYNQMYDLLGPINEMASRYSIAILLVLHMNKAVAMSAKYRTIGSTAVIGSVRAAWLICRDPEDEERRDRIMVAQKQNNVADDDCGLRFRILNGDGDIGKVEWIDGTCDLSADEALAMLSERKRRSGGKVDEVVQFLTETLKSGPVDVAVVREEAEGKGFSWRTVERHKAKLEITSARSEFGGPYKWRWEEVEEMPDESPPF